MKKNNIELLKSSNGKTSTISLLYCDEDTDIRLKNRSYQMYPGYIVLCHPAITWASTNKITIISFHDSFFDSDSILDYELASDWSIVEGICWVEIEREEEEGVSKENRSGDR